jgi:hypothetical protein
MSALGFAEAFIVCSLGVVMVVCAFAAAWLAIQPKTKEKK